MKIIGVIPARYGSSRLPGKVLADIGGKPMVQHIYENARESRLIQELYVAVDDERVRDAVESFGGFAVMTPPDCPSGTDRVAEVAKVVDCDIVCNIQADEPLTSAAIVDEAIQPLLDNTDLGFSTVMHSVDDPSGYDDPGVVKCVRDKDGFGLYFSRCRIPYPRYPGQVELNQPYEHIGIYAYRKDALLRFVSWPPSPLEKMEGLEMLRILDNDEKIYVAKSTQPFYTLSVDTPEDLERARAYFREKLAGETK
ncbi:MAG: 3-deoxy-manno-octulosonate cytidylyltransferase [Promethearchaeota archaeon]